MWLEAITIVLSAIFSAYAVRHVLFTFAALSGKKKPNYVEHAGYWTPFVSIIVPAHNEEKVIGNLLKKLSELSYPRDKYEVIIVNDGSTDGTSEIAHRYEAWYPDTFRVIDLPPIVERGKARGRGKPAALNIGLKYARGEFIVVFDADYSPQKDVIEKLIAPMADPRVALTQGYIVVSNPKTLVSRIVSLERCGGYAVDQLARDSLSLIPQYGGTCGAIRRAFLEEIGGWDERCLAEDTDLTFEAIKRGYEVRYVPQARTYEEAVHTWRLYFRQRLRWVMGHMQCLRKHMGGLLRSRVSLARKVDGMLLLWVYAVPILVSLAWVVGVYSVLVRPPLWVGLIPAAIATLVYGAIGNFAPFYEVGAGILLEKRPAWLVLLPLLLVSFFVCIAVSWVAVLKLAWAKVRGKEVKWAHTPHTGG